MVVPWFPGGSLVKLGGSMVVPWWFLGETWWFHGGSMVVPWFPGGSLVKLGGSMVVPWWFLGETWWFHGGSMVVPWWRKLGSMPFCFADKRRYEKKEVEQFVKGQIKNYPLDYSNPKAKTIATNGILAAVTDLYDIPDGGEEHEFVATTTRRVVEQFFYNAEKQTFDVTKTMLATTSMPAAAAGIPARAPSFRASRKAQHTEQPTAQGTLVNETLAASEVSLVLIYHVLSKAHTLPAKDVVSQIRCSFSAERLAAG